jgi:ribosomal protein S6--L-glutamate ligase
MNADAAARPRLVLGWKEWVALPELGLPAIMAKIDTGARTSAIHAAWIETYSHASQPMVRFGVHPVRRKSDIEIICTARVMGRRVVTSSNGEREQRYVIQTPMTIGAQTWPIEVTLTNRASMSYRMLLGRSALSGGVHVDPSLVFRQTRLSHRLYRGIPRQKHEPRPLHIAVLTTRPEQPSSVLLRRAATARGHRISFIDRRRLSLFIDADAPAILADGAGLQGFDAVISRGGRAASFTIAAVRQFELMGAVALNSADALARLREPMERAQRLALAHVSAPAVAVSFAAGHRKPAAEDYLVVGGSPSAGKGVVIRVVVVGYRAVAALEAEPVDSPALDEDERTTWRSTNLEALPQERGLAEHAARAKGLGLVANDSVPGALPFVIDINAVPPLAAMQRQTGAPIAEAIIAQVESLVASRVGAVP